MLVNRNNICESLRNEFTKSIGDKETITERVNSLLVKYNVPIDHSSDLLTMRTDIVNEPDFVLYCVTDIVVPKKITKWFTDSEIKKYSESKFKVKKVKFPIRINAVMIAEDQFIGTISSSELMRMRDGQIIYYNENTQRQLKHNIDGGTEYYSIDVNQKTVSEISNLMSNGMYISDPITINMPEDALYDYDEFEKTLIIREANHFDIIDGYHRYLAISNIHNLNKKFNLNLEIRIVCFSESKAQQFIWQTNQQTKLRKLDSDAMNQTKAANQVVTRLNTDGSCNLVGSISRNKGIIDSGVMSWIVDYAFFKNISKRDERKTIINVSKMIKDAINELTEDDFALLNKPWKNDFLALCVLLVSDGTNNISEDIKTYYPLVKELNIGKTINAIAIRRIKSIIRKEA